MKECKIIRYANLEVVYVNVQDATAPEAMAVFDRSHEIIRTRPEKSVYSLVNAKGLRFNEELLQKVKEVVKKNNPYNVATAVFGLSALTKLMVNSIVLFTKRQIKITETEEEAKEWLLSKSLAAETV
ncbi:hypothetical protein [Fulvivirga ligni]|uniref:hypothetical protein n=1 Tax=Fulvivirga ligni TaxID=2904246 RepID=UPI001F366DB6|nr:hypothetical protein [Fulvivirga ligni]UII20373.1 hypothetical protein LVD16_21255 [Fulvivirga ligni]